MKAQTLFVASLTVAVILSAANAVQAGQVVLNAGSVIGTSGAWNGNTAQFGPQLAVDDQADTPTKTDVFGTNYWLGTETTNPTWFVLDLAQQVPISQIDLYNGSNGSGTGGDRATILFDIHASNSTQPGAGGLDLLGATLIAQGDFSATQSIPPPNPSSKFIVTPADQTTPYQYLRFTAVSSFNRGSALNEILVFAVEPVPEPSTWALGVLGLLGFGVTAWRRRKRRC